MADEVTPFPKAKQLARGERRYRRKVASTKTWQKLWDEKGGPCRICSARRPWAPYFTLHHLVTREDHGDDVADNLVPICGPCHEALHKRSPAICRLLLTRLSHAEYAYMIDKAGEDYPERAYGVSYER